MRNGLKAFASHVGGIGFEPTVLLLQSKAIAIGRDTSDALLFKLTLLPNSSIFAPMRFVAGFLAFFVMIMSVQPEISAILSFSTTECCSSDHCSANTAKQTSEEKQDDSCCGNGFCNPFLSCCTCAGFPVNFGSFKIFITEFTSHTIAVYKSTVPSQFSPDFWQPPKIG